MFIVLFNISYCFESSIESIHCVSTFSVPLHVKLKVGRTWGSLVPFPVDQDTDVVPGF